MRIHIVLSGRNYDAGEAIPAELTLAEGASLDDALAALAGHLPGGNSLPATCLVAVSGTHLGTLGGHRPRLLRDGDEVLLLTPVAGG
ncbi:MAG: MoaD/ThiS family protein [Thermoguttaceae bacterium]|jgi:molybdopterin converting factor small subunit